MAEYSGTACVISWITGGTITLQGDFRSLKLAPTVDLYDASAGSDTHKSRVVGIKDMKVDVSLVMQSGGTASDFGTALAEGVSGTLIVGPEGTATGNRKYTIPAISLGAQINIPYNNVVDMTNSWMGNGAFTRGAY